MNTCLIRLFLVISSLILVSGCTTGGNEESTPKQEETFGPLPSASQEFVDIVEPYLATSSDIEDGYALSLYSYQTAQNPDEQATNLEVFKAESDLIVSLDTEKDSQGKSEYTLFASNDSIYVLNHESNQIRLLLHFTTSVCDILPIDSVNSVTLEIAPDVFETTHSVVHAERVYIETADDGESIDACGSVSSKKRYYELPLDFDFDIGVDDDGEIDSVNLVNEDLAKAKLIFGWVESETDTSKDSLSYGYLGFDSERQTLSLFDKDQSVVWQQNRNLQKFDSVNLGRDQFSSEYLFHVETLKDQFYLIQLGLDVFVVDAGPDLLAKKQSQVGTVLNDRVFTLPELTLNDDTYITPVKTIFDASNLFLLDQENIYRLAYQEGMMARDPEMSFTIVPHNPTSFTSKSFEQEKIFSQFDLTSCNSSDAACLEANDIAALDWQFFVPCEEAYGCELVEDVSDFCETAAEKLVTQSTRPLCEASNYQHITELNDTSNDAALLAHMQYADFVRDLDISIQDDALVMVVKMSQKELLLNYQYLIGLEQPKTLREQVLFGKRASLQALRPFFMNGDLYLNALQQSSVRSNECYKNGQRVACARGEFGEQSPVNKCTGTDLELGLCFSEFKEFESMALYCSATQLADSLCNDNNLSQLRDFAVEGASEDAAWLTMYSYSTDSYSMYLLEGNHQEAVLNNVLDEGRLFEPTLYSVDADGQKDQTLAKLSGVVEQALGGWFFKDQEPGVAEVFAHLDLISEEIKQVGGTSLFNKRILSKYFLEQTFATPASIAPDSLQAVLAGQREF